MVHRGRKRFDIIGTGVGIRMSKGATTRAGNGHLSPPSEGGNPYESNYQHIEFLFGKGPPTRGDRALQTGTLGKRKKTTFWCSMACKGNARGHSPFRGGKEVSESESVLQTSKGGLLPHPIQHEATAPAKSRCNRMAGGQKEKFRETRSKGQGVPPTD